VVSVSHTGKGAVPGNVDVDVSLLVSPTTVFEERRLWAASTAIITKFNPFLSQHCIHGERPEFHSLRYGVTSFVIPIPLNDLCSLLQSHSRKTSSNLARAQASLSEYALDRLYRAVTLLCDGLKFLSILIRTNNPCLLLRSEDSARPAETYWNVFLSEHAGNNRVTHRKFLGHHHQGGSVLIERDHLPSLIGVKVNQPSHLSTSLA
jgi:hypothetical protein